MGPAALPLSSTPAPRGGGERGGGEGGGERFFGGGRVFLAVGVWRLLGGGGRLSFFGGGGLRLFGGGGSLRLLGGGGRFCFLGGGGFAVAAEEDAVRNFPSLFAGLNHEIKLEREVGDEESLLFGETNFPCT